METWVPDFIAWLEALPPVGIYAVLLGVTILYGTLTVFVNLITDLAYAWFDPKIRY